MTPNPPNEAEMTPEQRKALRRIQMLIAENFHRGMATIIYRGTDDKLHVQVVSNANNEAEAIDLARRTVQEVERSTTGLITTLCVRNGQAYSHLLAPKRATKSMKHCGRSGTHAPQRL